MSRSTAADAFRIRDLVAVQKGIALHSMCSRCIGTLVLESLTGNPDNQLSASIAKKRSTWFSQEALVRVK